MTKTIDVKQIRGHIDFAILTIREDEFEAVLQRFSPRCTVFKGRQIYEYCRLGGPDGRTAHVAVGRTHEQGQSFAQSVARDMIEDLEPGWLILVGIAGGICDSEFSLGDVLLASSLLDFSITAAIEERQPSFRPAGGPVHPAVARLLADLPAWRKRLGGWNQAAELGSTKPQLVAPEDIDADCYYGATRTRETVRDTLRKHFPAHGTIRPPLYKVGAVATSNVLLKDTELLNRWRDVARHITHVEMEAGGAYIAARHGGTKELPLLCVRGISDIVGFKRDDEWTQFACHAAASFLHALLSTLPLEAFDLKRGRCVTLSERAISNFPGFLKRSIDIGRDLLQSVVAEGTAIFARGNQKTPTLEAIVEAFEKSSSTLLGKVVAVEDRMPRLELGEVEQSLWEPESRVLCVLGSPGSGKTAILALLAKNAIDSGVATFAIKADVVPISEPFEEWTQDELGFDITALDAIKATSSRSKVLVVVDQLDALASIVDLKSDRLNAVIDFIGECSALPGVSVVCSCRNFDFYNDARFTAIDATTIDLALPLWEDVIVQLERHGIRDAETWPEPIRELLRTPQHLKIYLDRFAATGKSDPLNSYQQMLDDLWTCTIDTSAERDLLYRLTKHCVDNEVLWAPIVQFEEDKKTIDVLVRKQILQIENRTVGFRHQSMLEYSKARLFTKENKSLSSYVLERQDAIFVRPTVWAVLGYLRDANRAKYLVEIQDLFGATLRLHLRYLLIEFLGQVPNPDEHEISLLAQCVLEPEDRVRALIAIRGKSAWFHALGTSHFPVVMQGPKSQQWPMISVIMDAWDFARETCIALIEEHWLPDPEKDDLTWRAMREIGKWDERTVEMVCAVVRRADADTSRLYWAEDLVYAISADQPSLAPRFFGETVLRINSGNLAPGASRGSSPLESTHSWYELPAVAEAAPSEFLRAAWQWLVNTCEAYHAGADSSVLYQYTGYCLWLDDRPGWPEAAILKAFCTAIDLVAAKAPNEFVDITRPSWTSENAVVHRLIVRGLLLVVREDPKVGLQYLTGDRRRLVLGTAESYRQSDSVRLISSLARFLDHDGRTRLEQFVLSSSMYRDDVDVSQEQRDWDREARLHLLASIPAEALSAGTAELVQNEKVALPDWDQETQGTRTGFVRHVPPISKDQMLTAADEDVLAAITKSSGQNRLPPKWVEVEGGWEEPGGALAGGRELGELAKEHPRRAIELINALVANGQELVAAEAIRGLSSANLADNEIFEAVQKLSLLSWQSEELRSEISSLLYARCKTGVGLPDEICALLEEWLAQPWDSSYAVVVPTDSVNGEDPPESIQPILWSHGGGILDTDRSFWPLLAATNGYLMRTPPDTDQWLSVRA